MAPSLCRLLAHAAVVDAAAQPCTWSPSPAVYAIVTFCVVLQPNLGTASQFVIMRAAGAVVGGALGLVCCYLTYAANGARCGAQQGIWARGCARLPSPPLPPALPPDADSHAAPPPPCLPTPLTPQLRAVGDQGRRDGGAAHPLLFLPGPLPLPLPPLLVLLHGGDVQVRCRRAHGGRRRQRSSGSSGHAGVGVPPPPPPAPADCAPLHPPPWHTACPWWR